MEELSNIFKALSNKHSLIIFHELLQHEGLHIAGTSRTCCGHHGDGGSCCVGDLGRIVELAPSTISHHIRELKNAGLIDIRRERNYLYCSVNKKTWQKVLDYFKST